MDYKYNKVFVVNHNANLILINKERKNKIITVKVTNEFKLILMKRWFYKFYTYGGDADEDGIVNGVIEGMDYDGDSVLDEFYMMANHNGDTIIDETLYAVDYNCNSVVDDFYGELYLDFDGYADINYGSGDLF